MGEDMSRTADILKHGKMLYTAIPCPYMASTILQYGPSRHSIIVGRQIPSMSSSLILQSMHARLTENPCIRDSTSGSFESFGPMERFREQATVRQSTVFEC